MMQITESVMELSKVHTILGIAFHVLLVWIIFSFSRTRELFLKEISRMSLE